MKMDIDKMYSLVENGLISSFEIINLNNEGEPGKSAFRNTQRLIINFPGGEALTIEGFCSGSSENVTLHIK